MGKWSPIATRRGNYLGPPGVFGATLAFQAESLVLAQRDALRYVAMKSCPGWDKNMSLGKRPEVKRIWVCLKMLCTPFTQWFCWSLSLLNGHFIGGIPHFWALTFWEKGQFEVQPCQDVPGKPPKNRVFWDD
jgi:hypothetical protein